MPDRIVVVYAVQAITNHVRKSALYAEFWIRVSTVMTKTLDELEEWARLLRKENHPLAETMEEIAEGWRECLGKRRAGMKWIDYGANAVSDYDFDSRRNPETFYYYAYLDLICIKDKCLLHFEIDQSRFRYFCLAVQFGGDSFFRISANIWRVGLDFCIWGYG